ncbi:50S ribosomal protein L25/general stress protein Ctc [[Phormidium ambiguum] IAM M-71]|uniref:Large ribosomal subunit protein bL25 n=1 Tax=[Phormidium ambiguum] IAM M-71 TaxID=454136 RepID=A0A1U7IMF3_9CYAN|nr:50S ribosomal protein L25/general stress protein Ctc [Phormidium ambiguum]OKH38466.1 50S ribosomal protein L25/general stress protein Ctc [Phormidium ambiguum IAM M-71]
MELTVECQKRTAESKPNTLRRNNLIPAVLYGHNGTESVALTLDAKVAETLVKKASLNNTLINLNIPDASWSGKTLLREVQTHPAKGFIYHLSFFAVASQKSLEVEVPLRFIGEAAGVKLSGGMLDPVMTEVTVQCPPDGIPDAIEINVSAMNVGDALHIREVPLPPGVRVVGDPDQVVVSVLRGQGGSEEAAE